MTNWRISLLTAVSVLLHAALGCCAHHAHAATDGATQAGPRLLAATHRCAHHRHKAPTKFGCAEDARRQAPCPHQDSEPCDEAECVFVAVNSAPVDLVDGAATQIANGEFSPAADDLALQLAAPLLTSQFADRHPPGAGQLRAHLLLLALRN